MEIKKVHYPYEPDTEGENEWFRFGHSENAVRIDDAQVEEWVNECIESVKKQLENGIESPYQFQASGDTIVIVFYSQDVPEDVFADENYFNVIVAKNYEEGNFFIENLKKPVNNKIKISDKEINLGVGKFRIGDYEIEIKERRDF